MNARAITLSTLATAALAGAAGAQVDSVYVSGIEHQSVGNATFDTPEGRRLPVRNLGSSGQDGVEIKLNSMFGGGAGVLMNGWSAAPGSEIKIRHRGWDGLIYGTHRVASSGDGTGTINFDYSTMGATSVHVVEYDSGGSVIADDTYPGGVGSRPWVPNWYCADGSVPIMLTRTIYPCPTCPAQTWIGWACADGSIYTYGNPHGRIMIQPNLPVGVPTGGGEESTLITAKGLSGIDVLDADVLTFSDLNGLPPGEPVIDLRLVQSHGLGAAQISEECADPAGTCAQGERRLPVRNLGSSGQDGVDVQLGAKRVTGFSMDLAARVPHVTLLKVYDDAGTEQRITTTADPATGQTDLDADFSDLGASGYHLTLLDGSGVVVGPPDGTDQVNGGPRPMWNEGCPPGSIAHYYQAGTPSNPVWVLWWCEIINAFVLPGGTVVSNVAAMVIEPLGATTASGPIRGIQVLGSEGERDIVSLTLTNACPSDFNMDGFVTGDDADAFYQAFDAGDAAADFDGNGFVNGDDADGFAIAFDAGC